MGGLKGIYLREIYCSSSTKEKGRRDLVNNLEATICMMKELARYYSNDAYQDICKYKFQLHDICNKKS